MSNNSKNTNGILFMAGAIAGGALVYFLQTPRGRKLRDTLIENADQMTTTLKDKAAHVASDVKSRAEGVLSSASDLVSSAHDKVVGTTHSAADSAEETITEFQKGIDNAHAKMQTKLKS